MALYVTDPDTGLPVAVHGYAAVYNSMSPEPHEESGHHLIFSKGCFENWLARGGRSYLGAYHFDGTTFAASRSGNLQIWSDDVGLAFEAKNIAATAANAGIVAQIARGRIQGCSIRWRTVRETMEDLRQSKPVNVISAAEVLHLTVCDHPRFPQAGCWLSNQDMMYLPNHLGSLARAWHQGRNAGLAAIKARQKPKAPPKAKAKRRPAPFTDHELEELGREQEAVNRLRQAYTKRRRAA